MYIVYMLYIIFFLNHYTCIYVCVHIHMGFPCGSAGKEATYNSGALGLIPGLGRSLGERKDYPLQYSHLENSIDCIVHRRRQWQATPVLLPRKSHGWRSLVGCSPWGR